MPQQYTTADGSLQGTIDGVNTVFTLGVSVQTATVFKNGLLMNLNVDCAFASGTIVFFSQQIPHPGDVITAIA